MKSWLVVRSLLVAWFCMSLGCDPKDGTDLNAEFEDIVRTRSSLEFSCAAGAISVEDLDGYAYRASGCGDYADYECGYSDAQGNGCGNHWVYVCSRAAQDNPSRLVDAGSE